MSTPTPSTPWSCFTPRRVARTWIIAALLLAAATAFAAERSEASMMSTPAADNATRASGPQPETAQADATRASGPQMETEQNNATRASRPQGPGESNAASDRRVVGKGGNAAFEVRDGQFFLGGRPFQILSGELHYPRIPRAYWRHRLQMARAMGLNTISTYVFWALHEPQPGHFDFSGNADLAAFIRMAGEEGLKLIVRPGPYVCGEWDFGGLPPWLLNVPGLRIRTSDPKFTAPAGRYLQRVMRELTPLLASHGGPVILLGVENEYGSFGSDKAYLRFVRDTLRQAGADVPLFTCDGPDALRNGSIEGAFPSANISGDIAEGLTKLRAYRGDAPLLCPEIYPDWFEHWGEAHQPRDLNAVTGQVRALLQQHASFNFYMLQGGTNFGFIPGANTDADGRYQATLTRYVYDSPLDEAGHATPKFDALRALLAPASGEPLPPIPAAPPLGALPAVALTEVATLSDNLPVPTAHVMPPAMEDLGQYHGLMLYRTTLPAGAAARLTIRDLHDYGFVRLRDQLLATLDRRKGENAVAIPARAQDAALSILVEAEGRVNYGPFMMDRKGITDRVEFPVPYPAGVVMNWQVYSLPLDAGSLRALKFRPASAALDEPAFYRGRFSVPSPADTYLDLSAWPKGYVWVNGHPLGRYWNIGPQQTLYLPGCWLREGENELVVFAFGRPGALAIKGVAEPISTTSSHR